MFFHKYKSVRPVRKPISVGIDPVRPLELKYRLVNLVRYPNSVGIVPVKELELKSRYVNFVSNPTSVGIVPLSILKEMSQDCKLVITVPFLVEFKTKVSSVKFWPAVPEHSVQQLHGIAVRQSADNVVKPAILTAQKIKFVLCWRLFELRYTVCKLDNLPSSDGTEPVSRLEDRSMNVKLVSEPISVGMVPVR